jgi:type IV secretion system protein VirD4
VGVLRLCGRGLAVSAQAPSSPVSGPLALAPGQAALFAIAAVAIAALLTLWLALKASAFLFAGGWPEFDLRAFTKALFAMPPHFFDPAQAFGRPVRRELAEPAGFWALYLALAGAEVAGLLALRRAWSGGLAAVGIGSRRAPSARWAARRDLRPLAVSGPEPGRVILGRFGRSLLAAEERQSVLVVAPPQSGKTTGLAIPALLEWQGPVIATSVKTDLLRDTLARRRELGDVAVFDPAAATGIGSTPWSPLGSSGSWYGAQRMAGSLCSVSRARSGSGLEDSEFWHKAAAKLLAPLLLAAKRSGAAMADVVRWIETQERIEVRDALREAGEEAALRAAEANWSREERQRSSIYTTAETVLEAYGDPRVLEASKSADISPAHLLGGGAHTLYLCGPAHEQARLAPVFTALLEEVVSVAYEASSVSGRPLDPPLLIVGDELANIAPIRSLPTIASTGAGQGILLISVFQDLAQVRERWGQAWPTIASSHRAKLFGTGLGDPESLDYVRRLAGEASYAQRSRTAAQLGHHSQTESTTYRSLAPANVVREAEPGSAVLLYGRMPPARLRLRAWYEDAGLRALADPERGPGEDARDRRGALR